MVESYYDCDINNIQMIPVFVAEINPDAEIILSQEHSEYKWVTSDEAREYLTFHLQRSSIDLVEREFILREPPRELELPL